MRRVRPLKVILALDQAMTHLVTLEDELQQFQIPVIHEDQLWFISYSLRPFTYVSTGCTAMVEMLPSQRAVWRIRSRVPSYSCPRIWVITGPVGLGSLVDRFVDPLGEAVVLGMNSSVASSPEQPIHTRVSPEQLIHTTDVQLCCIVHVDP